MKSIFKNYTGKKNKTKKQRIRSLWPSKVEENHPLFTTTSTAHLYSQRIVLGTGDTMAL